ncbi:hypothetical protein LY12_002010 [Prauserella alba]|uniref:Aminoglycoside phosphotransferase domain-containing protein n=1 Tax=Prauserella alba TaxID=176898 RepID=A0ABP4GBS1_9PSEU|nr:hypothetical protein [Prauserella alba]
MGGNAAPQWLIDWCREHLHSTPTRVLFHEQRESAVFGLRLPEQADVVVKARRGDGRLGACVEAQRALAERWSPCPRPRTPVLPVGPLAVHAEELRAGGGMLPGSSPDVAERYASVFAELMAELAEVRVSVPRPNPRWVRWDHRDEGLWPSVASLDGRNQDDVPPEVDEIARRVRRRLSAERLPSVLGHADFEAQNLRWTETGISVVHDWDSLAHQPEAALVGAASGGFAGAGPATLAPVDSSAAFLERYQRVLGRRFTVTEQEIAWAASVWQAAHHARWEALHGALPVCGEELRCQADERLRLANA